MNAPLPTPTQSIEFASAWRREWRYSSWTVRFSALCLMVFYLFALQSPFFAPYDPTFQNRAMPDCPPMRLHVAGPADWSQGFFYTYPMTMVDRVGYISACCIVGTCSLPIHPKNPSFSWAATVSGAIFSRESSTERA